MKSLLVAFELAPACHAQQIDELASLSLSVTALFESYIEVVAIAPPFPNSWMAGEIDLSTPEVFRPCSEGDAYAAYERAFNAALNPGRCSWGGLLNAEEIGPFARRFDLICMARPQIRPPGPTRESVEHALFESGRPLLLASERKGKLDGKAIISWTDTLETARVTALALPILKRMQSVHLVSVQAQQGTLPSPETAVKALRRHGINAECSIIDNRGSVGQTVLEFAYEMKADLLVKGAYTQTRLRRLIFGGTTDYILSHSAIPILLAH